MKRKISIIFLVAILSGVSMSFAKEKPSAVERATDNYLVGLRLNNEGVMESAIFNIIKLKLVYPYLDYTKLAVALDSIAENSGNKVIQRKAYLASMYVKYPERFNWITNKTYVENNAFFDLLAVKLEQQGHEITTGYAISDSTK